jgi:hypothetical protein
MHKFLKLAALAAMALTCAAQTDWTTQVQNKPFADVREYRFTRTNGKGASGDLSVAGAVTVTVAPGPKGVAGTNTNHYVYISGGAGAAEAVLLTGGTCDGTGQASCTLEITTANVHTGAWAITSASSGVKEAVAAVGESGTVVLPRATLNVYAPLVVPTAISLIGQGYSTGAISGTILSCAAAADPCLVVADGLGSASGQGFGIHSGYRLRGPGAGTGLWLGGDPAGVFADAGWFGSFTRFENLYVDNFATALNLQNTNFNVFRDCAFNGLTRALLIPSTASALGMQPMEFYGCLLTVPSGAAVQMDFSGFDTTSLQFFGGQVAGTITGAAVDWHSYGTHYEPNNANDPVVDISASGQVQIDGGLISTHGAATPYQIRMSGAGAYTLSVRDTRIQCDAGTTVPTFIDFSSDLGGSLTLKNVSIAAAGTFTEMYTLGGTALNYFLLSVDLNAYTRGRTAAAAATTVFPSGNFPHAGTVSITGATVGGGGITAVAGLLYGQTGVLVTANAQTFTAGATIGNTITTTPGVPYTYYFDGAQIWLK